MRKTLVSVILVLLCGFISAKVYKPADITPVHLQDQGRYTSNPDGILSDQAVTRIDAAFRTVEDSTGIQTLVAVVGDIDPDDCFEFTHQLAEKVGVGRSSSNNGLVILLSTGERCVQFATGYGIEGVLPDAICKRVQERYMNPHFANGEWDEGMIAGAEALKEILLKGEYDDDEDDVADTSVLYVFLGILLLITGLVIAMYRKSRKCPKCGKIALKQVSISTISNHNGVKKELLTFKCSHCGFITSRNRTSYYSTGTGSHGSGPHIGGSFGGGGHMGGSYGGGHFGGGGAGSRF